MTDKTPVHPLLPFLICFHTLIYCVALFYFSQRPNSFHIFYVPSRLTGAIIIVTAFTAVSYLFTRARFSFGYFLSFYFYTTVTGYLWLNSFSDLNYNHQLSGLSAAASAITFLLPALFFTAPIRQVYTLTTEAFERLLTFILVLAATTILISALYNFRFVSLGNIYDFRNELKFPLPLSYCIGICSSALLPFAFGSFAVRRNYWRAGIALLLLVLFYPITLSKLAFFTPVWLLFIALISRFFEARIAAVLSLFLPTLFGVAAVTLFKQHGFPYFDLVIFRMLIVTSSAMDVYNDFFSNHDLTHFCQIAILKPLVDCPYQAQLSIVMSEAFGLGNFNASLFSTEGIASVGTIFAPVSVFACGLVIALVNRLSSGLPPRLVLISSAILLQVLINVPLTTSLLSHGGAVLFLLWYLTPRSLFQKEQAGADAPQARQFPRFFLTSSIGLILANLGLCCFFEYTPDFSYVIAKSDIRPETGRAYQTPVIFAPKRGYSLPTDSNYRPTSSTLTVFEDGHPLGPAHSLHADVRDQGSGRFSHWGNSVIFSTLDGTDPRTNGRVYSIKASTEVTPLRKFFLATILAFADISFLVLFRKYIIFISRARGTLILTGLAISLVLLAALAASGLLGLIVVAKNGPPINGTLALQTLQHALLGCLTSFGMWAAGAGVIRLRLRDPRSSLFEVLIPAFPVGVLLLAMFLVVALIVPWGRSVAVALWLACLVPLWGWRPPGRQVAAIFRSALSIIPFAIAFGIWLGLLWHGPTDTLPGSPSGDLTFYAGNIWSLANQPYPNFDLGYANGANRGYFNNLYPALGAALLYLPNFDPFLFILASGGASYVLLSALMLHLYVTDRASRTIGLLDVLILTLSVIVAARYPYWVAESIPMVFVPALTISVWWMAERGHRRYGWSVAAMLAGLSGSLLSKVATAGVLVPLGFAGIPSHIRSLPFRARIAVLGVAGIFGIYSAAMLIHFGPLFAAIADIGPESFRTPRWYFVCRDAGALLMVVLAWFVAEKPVALALSIGMASFFVLSFALQANFVSVCLVLGLIVFSDCSPSIYARTIALLAFALSLPALILGDQASPSSGVIWIACVGGATLTAVLGTTNTVIAPQLTFRRSASIAITILTLTALGLIGVTRGSIIAHSGWEVTQRAPLTPALKEIWAAVRERTPKHALVFTDQVDATQDLLGGWNTYAFAGQRQLYLSSYYTNFELRRDRQKLDDILTINKAVLDGSRSPQNVSTQRSYNSFYAVVAAAKLVPRGWWLIFQNSEYALYEIAG